MAQTTKRVLNDGERKALEIIEQLHGFRYDGGCVEKATTKTTYYIGFTFYGATVNARKLSEEVKKVLQASHLVLTVGGSQVWSD